MNLTRENYLENGYKHLPVSSYYGHDSVILAQVAAPLLTGGRTLETAVQLAYALIMAAESHLAQEDAKDLFNSPKLNYDLTMLKEKLGVAEDRSAKTYLSAAIPDPAKAEETWKKALAGERVFTRDMQKKILEAQKIAKAKKQKAAAQGRRKSSTTI